MIRDAHLSGHTIGQYRLLEAIGEGAVGKVYHGYQASLDRHVAIKILLPPTDSLERHSTERFMLEARTIASLEHPHILPIYEFGSEGGVNYIAMRLLTGGTLEERLHYRADTPPSLGEIATLLTDLADALTYAHNRGVIHRDIKSGNVMFDEFGWVYLVDFSIAKLMDANHGLTADGVVIGTPAYMPPEQWRGETLTPAADQYGLGVLAYQLVSGRMPFEASAAPQLMYKHLNELPPSLPRWRPDLPDAAAQAIYKAMAKRPGNRYESVADFAAAFAEAVANIDPAPTGFFTFSLPTVTPATMQFGPPTPVVSPIEELPLTGAAASTSENLAPRPMNIWLPATLGIGGGLLFVALLVGALLLVSRGREENTANSASTEAIAAALETATVMPTETTETRPTSLTTAEGVAPAALETAEATQANAPERTRVASVNPSLINTESFARLGEPLLLNNGDVIRSVDFAADSRTLAAASGARVRIWDTRAGESLGSLGGHTDTVHTVTFGLFNGLIASGDARGEIYLWNAVTGERVGALDGHSATVRQLAFSLDGRLLASSSDDGTLRIWNPQTGEALHRIQAQGGSIGSVTFAPTAARVAAAWPDYTVRVFEVLTGREAVVLTGHTEMVWGLAYSPDGTLLASASADNTVRVWELAAVETRFILRGSEEDVLSVAFSPDGSLIATSGSDNQVRLWNAETGELLTTLAPHEGWVFDVQFSPDGTRFASGGGDGKVQVWALPS